ncbi:putative ribonuclease H-like domain-containing protein [Tanacetum coccineum]
MTHLSPKRNMVSKAVLIRSGLVSLTTARLVNTAQPKTTVNSARPMTNVFNKAHSTFRRPINNKTTTKNSNLNHMVNTLKGTKVNTVKPKAIVNAASPKAVLNAVKGNQVNAVKASACWVWKPKAKVIDHSNPQQDLEEKCGIDSRCSRHITGNMSYLTDFEETDEGYVAFGVPRKNNMYSVDLKNIVPKGGLTCLFAKATSDESKLWHRRLGHINFKTMNKLVKGNLVRGLPSKLFENNQTCVACQKGKQHRASCKSKIVSSISQPLHMLHMDLFGLTFVKSLMKKMYCLVVTDDYSRFSWVFFLATKDETSGILKSFITGVENLIDQRVKVIRCDNGTEFKNKEMNQFCERKGSGPNWLFDINALTKSMNYKPVVAGNQSNGNTGTKARDDVGDDGKKVNENLREDSKGIDQEKEDNVNSTNNVNAASTNEVNAVGEKTSIELLDDPNMPKLEDIVYSDNDEDVGAEADMNNLNSFIPVSPIPTTRIHKDHHVEQIIGDLNLAPQTRRMTKNLEAHGLFGLVQQRTNHKDFQNCLFACFLSQKEPKKYVTEILKKFGFTDVKTASTPMETQKPLLKDEDGKEVDVHLYRSLMYLTSSRPDIIYLKGQPKLDLWYLKDSPFDLVAYTDSDYARASLDRKSTIGGCQFLGCRLISWQCKKQTVVANSITKAEYVAALSCYGQVLRIQNQLLDYGDSNEKKLIQIIKIHTYKNVGHLLTKAFDVNAAEYKLTTTRASPTTVGILLLMKVNAARHHLLLLGYYC